MNNLDPDTHAGLLRKAEEGEAEQLIESLSEIYSDDEERDTEIYRWLTISEGFGNDVEEFIDTMNEASSLRYDDDGFARGEIHFELGMSYLLGGDGLSLSFTLAEENLSYAVDFNYPDGIEGGEEIIEASRARLSGDALDLFDRILLSQA